MNQKRIIFGWWRSGTKLLAECHKNIGYHNFGEFFNIFSSCVVESTIPFATRMPVQEQKSQRQSRGMMSDEQLLYWKLSNCQKRIDKFLPFKDLNPSIITVWIGDLTIKRDIFSIIDDRHYLLPRRKNNIEQILSGLLTLYNLNYNGEIESRPITANIKHIDFCYNELKNTTEMQNVILNERRGQIVDFDKLINGQEDIGFDYTVNSTDQHNDLYKYFLNLDDVLSRINYLQKSD
jgi:hypothetical protein